MKYSRLYSGFALRWKNAEVLQPGELALALVKSKERIRPDDKSGRHVEEIKRSGADLCAVTS